MQTSTKYAPFDGTCTSGDTVPYSPAKLSLSGTTGTLYTPVMYPGNAFFFGRVAKSFYMSFTAVFDILDADGNTQSTPTISTANLVKRFTVPGNTPGQVKFQAQGGVQSVNKFTIDFSKGWYGNTSDLYGNPVQAYTPYTTLNIGGANGYVQIAGDSSVGSLSLQGMPAMTAPDGYDWYDIGLQVIASTPGYQIANASITSSYLQLTERFDQLSFSKNVASPGDLVSIVCPPVSSQFDTTMYRSGFADVKYLSIAGVATPLVLGTSVSSGVFTVTSRGAGTTAVKDTITFIVPVGATTGHIRFVSTTDITNTANTTDYYSTFTMLYIN